jgi:ParB family chromosome partitioning protein
VNPTVVKQRLKLAAVSDKLLKVYAEDGMTLISSSRSMPRTA